jgi:tetratricopeptide (TPR) repeat protein
VSGRPPAGSRSARRFLLLPLVAIALAAGIKLVTMYVFAATGANAYTANQYESSETNFGRLETLNVAEPWRAHVGVGDALYRQGDLLAAAAAFARALEVAPDRCEVRFNLAVTLEAQGDRLYSGEELVAGAGASADGGSDPAERYSAALGVVEAGECPSQRVDDPGDRLAETQVRLIAKLAALDADRADDEEALEPENATESERGDSEQIDELELRNESGASQREEARDRDTSGAIPHGESNW